MTRRLTKAQERKLYALMEREHMREVAQEVTCPESWCLQPPGRPCIDQAGLPLGRMDHVRRHDLAVGQRAAATERGEQA